MSRNKFKIMIGIIFFLTILLSPVFSSDDWPIYKGNIYFTGNNDEIIVKNNNLKWLFQADDRAFNPVVSGGMIFFVDMKGNVYCLNEDYGRMNWRINMGEISSQFKALSRTAGKVKYPLISGNTLFLTDPIAVYAINKNTGKVIWARTGMRQQDKGNDLYVRQSMPVVDGIYSDPIILNDKIFYGTRNMFISREIVNGHPQWENETVKSYGGFPTFYDEYVFTQSMDYEKNIYTVHCLSAGTGKDSWTKTLPKPMMILPPVIYKQRVYIPSSKIMYCLDLKTGEILWSREYGDLITSNPSFTDRSVLFSLGNSNIAIINPESGSLITEIVVAPKCSPYFVTVRDQLYIAYNSYTAENGKEVPYGKVRAVNFSDGAVIWEYKTPFPGGVSQSVASNGILFLPCGNYIYAIGTEYYSRVVDGGSGYAAIPRQPGEPEKKEEEKVKPPQPLMPPPDEENDREKKTRDMEIEVTDKDKQGLPAEVEVKKRGKDRIVYFEKVRVNKNGKIKVPEGDDVELLVTAPGYIPKKEIVKKDEKEKRIILDKIETGRTYTVDNINFEVNKAYLKKDSIDIIDKLIITMKQNPGMKVEIRGHTDSTGEEAYNQKLSERRADSVVEYMIKNGISPERLTSVGFGEIKPIASNETEEGRAKNRRTEFRIIK
ncbi:MAG: PQQ-binding-like beta-propeller repeat protein [Spirochaetes bacterium]|nr:PQQ-binding-like beta-propeller repeat protein [Spirochaetota bacterium]